MKNNLKICRKNKRMTTKEVSEKICVSKQAIYNIETGVSNPSVDTLMKLAELYNVSTDYLLGPTNFENFKSQYEHLQEFAGNSLLYKDFMTDKFLATMRLTDLDKKFNKLDYFQSAFPDVAFPKTANKMNCYELYAIGCAEKYIEPEQAGLLFESLEKFSRRILVTSVVS